MHNGKPSALGAISGCVAGLVAITPASGYVGAMPALLIGLIAGVVCFAMVAKVKAQIDAAIKQDRMKPTEGMRLLADYERGLGDQTYLSL